MTPKKFRAWDKINKKMYPVIILHVDGSVMISGDMVDGFFPANEVEVMQFTGLLDKNGQEIYEGDIVKVLDRDWSDKEKDTKTLIVYFHHGIFQLVSKEGIDELEKNEPNVYNPKWTETKLFKEYGRDIFEIIGNIYENENLLK